MGKSNYSKQRHVARRRHIRDLTGSGEGQSVDSEVPGTSATTGLPTSKAARKALRDGKPVVEVSSTQTRL